jgi:hypothetical protein
MLESGTWPTIAPMQRHSKEAGRVQTVSFEVRLQGVVVVSNVGANDTMHVFDRNKGFIHGSTGRARAFGFSILRMLLCSKFTLEDAATVYALICECKYPGIVSEAVVSISRVNNMLR